MRKKCRIWLGVLALSLLGTVAVSQTHAHAPYHSSHRGLGFALEDEYWNLVKEQNFEALAKKYSHAFQGNSPVGVITTQESLAQLKSSDLCSFTFQNFSSTRKEDVIVNAYNLFPVGRGLIAGSNISVWKKDGHHWKLESHSFFPLP